jgi:hypothetical protein
LLAPVPPGWVGVVLGIIQVIRAIVPRLSLGASSKEIGRELAFFAFQLFDFLLQRRDAAQCIATTTLPGSDLVTKFEIVAEQALDLGTQRGDLLAQVRHQGDQIRGGVTRDTDLNQLAVHDHHATKKVREVEETGFNFTEVFGDGIDGLGEALPRISPKLFAAMG